MRLWRALITWVTLRLEESRKRRALRRAIERTAEDEIADLRRDRLLLGVWIAVLLTTAIGTVGASVVTKAPVNFDAAWARIAVRS